MIFTLSTSDFEVTNDNQNKTQFLLQYIKVTGKIPKLSKGELLTIHDKYMTIHVGIKPLKKSIPITSS